MTTRPQTWEIPVFGKYRGSMEVYLDETGKEFYAKHECPRVTQEVEQRFYYLPNGGSGVVAMSSTVHTNTSDRMTVLLIGSKKGIEETLENMRKKMPGQKVTRTRLIRGFNY